MLAEPTRPCLFKHLCNAAKKAETKNNKKQKTKNLKTSRQPEAAAAREQQS